MPALLASCAAVILLGLLLRQWGHPGAGATAALVLAIHPWYIRYGVDARAYALVVPLCIGIAAIAPVLVPLVFGTDFADAVPVPKRSTVEVSVMREKEGKRERKRCTGLAHLRLQARVPSRGRRVLLSLAK